MARNQAIQDGALFCLLHQDSLQNFALFIRFPLVVSLCLRLVHIRVTASQLMRKARVEAVDLHHTDSKKLLFLAVGARSGKVLVDALFNLRFKNKMIQRAILSI